MLDLAATTPLSPVPGRRPLVVAIRSNPRGELRVTVGGGVWEDTVAIAEAILAAFPAYPLDWASDGGDCALYYIDRATGRIAKWPAAFILKVLKAAHDMAERLEARYRLMRTGQAEESRP